MLQHNTPFCIKTFVHMLHQISLLTYLLNVEIFSLQTFLSSTFSSQNYFHQMEEMFISWEIPHSDSELRTRALLELYIREFNFLSIYFMFYFGQQLCFLRDSSKIAIK